MDNQTVLLITEDEQKWFLTVKEAQDAADNMEAPHFEIFTLYSTGERPSIDWCLNTEHTANIRENKKTEAAERRGKWSGIEILALEDNLADGVSMIDIAHDFKRIYNSFYVNAHELKEKAKKRPV
jgi:hypothetical protein